jgi:hypothetical protein
VQRAYGGSRWAEGYTYVSMPLMVRHAAQVYFGGVAVASPT